MREMRWTDLGVLQGCPRGGGSEPAQPEFDDVVPDTIPPDCSAQNLTAWQELYCFRALAPDSAQHAATLQALDQISGRGELCASIAQRGRGLLASGQIRFFVWRPGDAGGYGGPGTGIQLDADFPRLYSLPGSIFEKTLVHEIDHVLGYDHIDANGLETPHSAQCS